MLLVYPRSLSPPTALSDLYILYLDESGTTREASCFVLAGLAIFEREIFWYSQDLDNLQAQYFPNETEPVQFHVTKLRVPDGQSVEEPWNSLDAQIRRELKDKIYEIIRNRRGILFGCVVEKTLAQARNEDPYERAFEDLVSRFDLFLSRVNKQLVIEGKEEQRGLIVLAESSYEKTISILGHRLREKGTRWGTLHNVSDVPLFAPSRDTRLLQYADFCSNATYGRYHHKLANDFDKISPKFDQEGGIIHGLSHLTTEFDCGCTACFSRRGRQLI